MTPLAARGQRRHGAREPRLGRAHGGVSAGRRRSPVPDGRRRRSRASPSLPPRARARALDADRSRGNVWQNLSIARYRERIAHRRAARRAARRRRPRRDSPRCARSPTRASRSTRNTRSPGSRSRPPRSCCGSCSTCGGRDEARPAREAAAALRALRAADRRVVRWPITSSRPSATANYGELLCRPRPVTAQPFGRDGGGTLRASRSCAGKWVLVASDSGACPAACVRQAHDDAPGAPRPRPQRLARRARVRGGRPAPPATRRRSRPSRAPMVALTPTGMTLPPGAGQRPRPHLPRRPARQRDDALSRAAADRKRMLRDLRAAAEGLADRVDAG